MSFFYRQAENPKQNELHYFPGIFAEADQNFLQNQVWQRFPNGGRRRREIRSDPVTGQQYETFTVDVEQIGNEPLKNESLSGEMSNFDGTSGYDDDDEFDDKFEEDFGDFESMQNQKASEHAEGHGENDFDFEIPRWTIYEALSSYLNT